MSKRPNAESWMHDGDDFRVSKEHTVKKRSKKRIGAAGKGRPAEKIKIGSGASGRTAKYVGKKTARKRIAGK